MGKGEGDGVRMTRGGVLEKGRSNDGGDLGSDGCGKASWSSDS